MGFKLSGNGWTIGVASVMLLTSGVSGAEDVASLWGAVLSLDSGPGQVPKSADEAKDLDAKHVAKQEKALRRFLEVCGEDTRLFEAETASGPGVDDSGGA